MNTTDSELGISRKYPWISNVWMIVNNVNVRLTRTKPYGRAGWYIITTDDGRWLSVADDGSRRKMVMLSARWLETIHCLMAGDKCLDDLSLEVLLPVAGGWQSGSGASSSRDVKATDPDTYARLGLRECVSLIWVWKKKIGCGKMLYTVNTMHNLDSHKSDLRISRIKCRVQSFQNPLFRCA